MPKYLSRLASSQDSESIDSQREGIVENDSEENMLKGSQDRVAIPSQSRSSLAKVLFLLSPAFLALGLVATLHYWKDIPIRSLTADPAAIVGQSFHLGFLSQLGIFLWSAMATICFLTATVLKIQPAFRYSYKFFVWSGCLTLCLGLDDVFLLHEEFFPFYLGISEKLIYALYAGFVTVYLWQFKRLIRRTDYTFLAIAFICFALSIGLDILELPYMNPYFFEDGFKFLGLMAWLVYFWQTATTLLRSHYARP